MRTKLISDAQRSDAWQYRDMAFTTMLIAQCLIILAIPIAAMGYEGVREVVALLFFVFTFLVCLISPGRVATIFAIGIHLWLGRLRARAHRTINYDRPDLCLYRSHQRLRCGELRSRLRDARAG